MTTILLAVFIVLPVIASPFCVAGGLPGRWGRAAAPFAALPILVLALLPLPFPTLDLPWLLLGTRLGLDGLGRLFLIVAAALWTTAGIFARGYVETGGRGRFFLFFLLALAGNLGLPLAQDALSFYSLFALMTFAAYGLVVHAGGREPRRAGRVYIVMAMTGEVFLLAGILLAVREAGTTALLEIPAGIAGSDSIGLITGCLLAGFGIKAGAVPLHVWLPLAHPVAPTPASAVLSGSMIKAGVLGWLRFLPLGEASLPGWGNTVILLGVVAAFFGVVVGLLQNDPKTVLAYSSISQMGLINVAVGVALAAPQAAPSAVAAAAFYAAHHGLAKGALFLGVGVMGNARSEDGARAWVALGLLLPALAVAGAPLTTGSLAKAQIKYLAPLSPGGWPLWLEGLLPLSAFATTLLMAHFLVLTRWSTSASSGSRLSSWLVVPWSALLAGVAFALWMLPRRYPVGGGSPPAMPGIGEIAFDVLPLVFGVLVAGIALHGRPGRSVTPARPRIAPGDILVPLERVVAALPDPMRPLTRLGSWDPAAWAATRWYEAYASSNRHDLPVRLELRLTRWTSAVFMVVLLAAMVLVLLARGT